MPLILSVEEVRELFDMREAIPVVEKATLEFYKGQAFAPPRMFVDVLEHQGRMLSRVAYVPQSRVLGIKYDTFFQKNPEVGLGRSIALITLNDVETGKPLVIMDGTLLTAARTAAASGVATKYLANPQAKVLGILGAGRQARAHFWAMILVRKIEKVKVYDLVPEVRDSFRREMTERFGLDVEAVGSEEEVVRGADIVVTATTSLEPVVRGEWLEPGVHINAVGGLGMNRRELDSEVVRRAKVVVSRMDEAMRECGEILIPMREGKIPRDHVYAELGEILAGEKRGRVDLSEITLFKNLGIGVWDVVAADVVYKKALERQVGTQVKIWES